MHDACSEECLFIVMRRKASRTLGHVIHSESAGGSRAGNRNSGGRSGIKPLGGRQWHQKKFRKVVSFTEPIRTLQGWLTTGGLVRTRYVFLVRKVWKEGPGDAKLGPFFLAAGSSVRRVSVAESATPPSQCSLSRATMDDYLVAIHASCFPASEFMLAFHTLD